MWVPLNYLPPFSNCLKMAVHIIISINLFLQELMTDPVVAEDGISYQREAFEEYIQFCTDGRSMLDVSARLIDRRLDRTIEEPYLPWGKRNARPISILSCSVLCCRWETAGVALHEGGR